MRERKREWRLWWVSADGLGQIACGFYLTRGQAEADIPDARTDLIGECADAQERAQIEAGRFVVVGPDGARAGR